MAIVVKDRVKETSTTTGTADFTLIGAVVGFQAFSAIGNTNFTYYAAVDPSTGAWEVGYGQYQTSGPTLTRNTILSSSAAGAKVSFGAGVKDVFCTYPSEKAIYEELAGNVLIDGGPITVVGSGVTSYTSFGAALAEMYANETAFAQMYVQNLNSSATASTDIVAYNNLGDGTNNFIDMGISSSSYSDPTYPIFTAGSGYLYNDGGELIIGSATDDVVLFAGGVALTDEAVRIDKTSKDVTTAADVNVGGALDVNGAADIAGAAVFGSTVTLNANPSLALQAATKQYVDNQVTAGLHIHEPVRVETTGNLTATYVQGGTTFNITDITSTTTVTTSVNHGLSVNDQIWLYTSAGNGLSTNTAYFVFSIPALNQLTLSLTFGGAQITGLTNAAGLTYATRANSGVGATLTNSGAQAALQIDGINLVTTNRVMVRLQTNGAENGVYTVTTVGSGSTNWVLTRATDSNQVNPADPNGVGTGDYYFTREGLLNAGDSHVLTTEPNTMILGYTPLTFTQFSGGVVYTGGTNINVTGQVISLTGTVAPTNGGTGVNTVTTGDLLYGSATNTWSKLPLGSAYKSLSVNGAGTQVEWNAVALDQSGAVSGTLPVGNGGTGINSYAQGEMLFANTTTSLDKVTANTTTTKKFLSQTGNGTAGLAPTWAQPAASDITGLAPSATTDTTDASNITSGTLGTSRLSGSYTGITGVGTLTAGTWNATAIGAVYGGTGLTSYAVGDLLYADTTTSLARLADVAVGNALISGGVSANPSWGKIGLSTHVDGTLPIANGGTGSTSTQFVALGTNVSGTLPVANGGTGAATFTANNVLLGNGTSALQVVAPGANGNVLQSNGTTWVSAVNPSSQVYPGAGIANSTGTSWATSYSTTGSGTVVALATSPSLTTPILGTPQSGNFSTGTFTWPTFNQNTTGNAATATLATTATTANALNTGNSYTGAGFTSTGTVAAAGASGFTSSTFVVNSRNPIWRFGNADTYGMSYFQATAGIGGLDTIGFHFGTATAAASAFKFISNGNFQATGAITSLLAPAAINTTTPGLTNYGLVFNGASSTNNAQALTWTWDSGGGAQAGIYVQSSGAYGTKMYLATTDSFATGAKTAVTIDHTGAVTLNRSSLTVAGTVAGTNITTGGNTTGTAANADLLNSISAVNLYNNMGNVHATRTAFDATTPSYGFGYRYVQGNANGPGTGQAQYYSWYIGLGSDYPATGAGSYGAMFAVGRTPGTPYLSVRYNESNSFGAWQKVAAGFADTAGNTSSISSAVGGSYTWTGAQNFQSNQNTGTGASPPLQAYSTSGLGAMMSFHRAGVYAINMGLDSDNVFRIGGWSAAANRLQMDMSGNLTMAGNVTAYSDETLKKDWADISFDFIEQLAHVKHGTYTRIDSDERQMGVSAQGMQKFAPEVVSEDNEGKLSLAYGNAALVAAIKLAESVVELKSQVTALEAKLEQLTKDKS
jgi:hypothetical protein